MILINIVVKSWAAGNLGNATEDEEESGGVLESHGNSRQSYLANLMKEANMEGLEISSKFKFLLDVIAKASSKRILIFSSWYVSLSLYFCRIVTVNGFFNTANGYLTTVNVLFSTVSGYDLPLYTLSKPLAVNFERSTIRRSQFFVYLRFM